MKCNCVIKAKAQAYWCQQFTCSWHLPKWDSIMMTTSYIKVDAMFLCSVLNYMHRKHNKASDFSNHFRSENCQIAKRKIGISRYFCQRDRSNFFMKRYSGRTLLLLMLYFYHSVTTIVASFLSMHPVQKTKLVCSK